MARPASYVDDKLQVGDFVDASAARGGFTLRPGDAPVVLLSAGIGVTPVLAMLHALAAEASTREIWWLYGARNGREHPFAEETRGLLKALAHSRSHIRYSSPDPEDRPNVDFDAPGRLNMQVLQALESAARWRFLYLRTVDLHERSDCRSCSLGSRRQIAFTPRFSAHSRPSRRASPRRRAGRPTSLAGPIGGGPLVSFARTGLNVPWGATFQSLLELAEACDVPMRWSCRTGVCHTCETSLVAGTVRYRPDPIDVPADGNVLICCSQPEGDVVIDL